MTALTEFFKILTDPTRLRCLMLLATHPELCVCELCYALQLPQSKISRHLSILKLHKLVSQRRIDQWTFYRLNPRLTDWQHNILQLCLAQTNAQLQRDQQRLHAMPHRPLCEL